MSENEIGSSSASTQQIKVQGHIFTISSPYSEGQVLRANEAAALNQLRAENLRNNFASKVKAHKEKIEKEGGEFDHAGLQNELAEYDSTYDFGVRRVGATREVLDPVEAEAMSLAMASVKAAIKKKGHKVSDVGLDKIKELAKQALDQYPAFREKAKSVVALRSEIGSMELSPEV